MKGIWAMEFANKIVNGHKLQNVNLEYVDQTVKRIIATFQSQKIIESIPPMEGQGQGQVQQPVQLPEEIAGPSRASKSQVIYYKLKLFFFQLI